MAQRMLESRDGQIVPERAKHMGDQLIKDLTEIAFPFQTVSDLDKLIQNVSGRKVVMLGEASHGTHEFYQWRRFISQKLIEDYGFTLVAVEGDWPPCSRLNDFIHGKGGPSIDKALSGFHRWPTWMWANSDVVEFANWLWKYNARTEPKYRTSFFGMDVYSFFESMDEVIRRLSQIDLGLANKIRERYECFAPFQRDEKAYARSLLTVPEGCEREVLENLKLLLKVRLDDINESAPLVFGDVLFDAQQNARIAANAESYYRTLVHGDQDSWNVRDSHMHETLKIILDRHGPHAKAIVWAHNTHIGDYRATDMNERGQINIGGLARETWGDDQVALIGLGTHRGEVIASHAWGGPTERMIVPPGRVGSYEDAFHQTAKFANTGTLAVDLEASRKRFPSLREVRGHRAIGVVYNPRYERYGNYVPTALSERYDGFLFFDRTSALRPLAEKVDVREIPETWPPGT